jgi:glycosyltransferase involved in cell wall biosynthesis
MKIGIDCRLWDETGVGRYIRNLVLNLQGIDKKNDYALFILSRNRDEILKQVQNDKFQTVNTDIKWHTFEEQIKFPGILNKENLDLMHFPYYSIPIFYKRPFIITIHDLIVNHYSTGKASTLPGLIYRGKRLAYKFVLNQSVKNANKIIAVSNATKQEVIDHYKVDKDKIVVTYEGADGEISNFTRSISLGQISNLKFKSQKYFLYVGNAYPHKNLNRLLEAFMRANLDIKLVLVGKEDVFYKRLKQKVQELNLTEKVIFLQNVTDEELFTLYKNALALVMPSLMEGFGLPALEAMASNCLVLASDIPSLKEVCSDAAIYFDPHSIDDIAKKMGDTYLNSKEFYNSKREKGLKRTKDFSWEKTARETLKIYENCVSKPQDKIID